MNWSEMTAFLI